MNEQEQKRRTGDTVAIDGDYQENATFHGSAPQRFWHQTRFRHCLELLAPKEGDRILDVGCGSGVFSNIVAKSMNGIHVTGIDSNCAAIEFSKKKYNNPNLNFMHLIVEDLKRLENRFEKICFLEVIEHIHRNQAEELLEIFHQLLEPGGRLVVSTPNVHSPWPIIEKVMDKLRLAPKMDQDQHVDGYTPTTLRSLCEGKGFHLLESRTILLASPWIAAMSWNLAAFMERVEQRSPFAWGCLVVQVFAS